MKIISPKLFIFLSCLLIFTGVFCLRETFFIASDPSYSSRVKTVLPQKRDILYELTESGIVQYKKSFHIYSEVGGKMKCLLVEPGETVRESQLLLEIENSELEEEEFRIRKKLNEAKSQLSFYYEYSYKEASLEMDVQLENAREDYQKALRQQEISEHAYQRGMIAQTEIEQVRKQLSKAEGYFELAQIQFNKRSFALKEEEKKIKEMIEILEKDLQKIKEKALLYQIRSPITGIVSELSKNLPSDSFTRNVCYIGKGDLLLTIGGIEGRAVEVGLLAHEAAMIKKDSIVYIESQNPLTTFEGKVINYPLDSRNINRYGQYQIWVEIVDEESNCLPPGSAVQCRFPLSRINGAISVPLKSIVIENGRKYCKILQESTIVVIPVVTGIDDGSFIEIIEGLNLQDQVVL